MNYRVSSSGLYQEYTAQMRKIADVKFAAAVLQWDQETYLPEKGSLFRGQQIATLTETAHRLFTDAKTGTLLEELKGRADLSDAEKKNVALSWEDYSKQKKYSAAFVRLLSETISKSFHAWMQARKENAFSLFEKDLQAIVELKKQETEILGYKSHPYDALLDEFEKGCTISMLDKIFTEIRQPLKDLLLRISVKGKPDDSFLHQHYPKKQQWDFGISLVRQAGFDFGAGRQDISEHPFTTSFNCKDVRITTRVDEHNLSTMTWSTIHETGHALYEQGLPEQEYGLPLGEFASVSMHESQSRLWENQVGRSLPYWNYWYPKLQEQFPAQLSQVPLADFYAGINQVVPSLIRTEADELTYHFHIMIRYDLEKSLVSGGLKVEDIPSYWNEQYASWLGLRVPDDKMGCLQDVHWSHGSFGYFPTYNLGSLYAAQLFSAASTEINDIAGLIGRGQTQPLLQWLRTHIHRWGRMYTSEELCEMASGKTLDIQCFLKYLLDKYGKMYDF